MGELPIVPVPLGRCDPGLISLRDTYLPWGDQVLSILGFREDTQRFPATGDADIPGEPGFSRRFSQGTNLFRNRHGMLYPIVDRRISSTDRRGHPDRRSEDRGTPAIEQRRRERRTRGERRQINLDRERLLRNLRLPGSQEEDEPRWFKYARLWLLPIVIAVGTTAIGIVIARMQTQTARAIAEREEKFQESIQEREQKNAIDRAEAELKTRRLEKIIDIFAGIIGDKPREETELGDKEREILRQKILSLVAYQDEALPFLVQLRSYGGTDASSGSSPNEVECRHVDGERDLACVVRNAARDSIRQILGESQLDIRGQVFRSTGEPLNLRHRKYAGYNLSNSKFIAVNLYTSDFSEATLKGVHFKDADLVRASFKGANLTNARFINSDLKETNFEHAKLKGVTLENCRGVNKSIFSLDALLRLKDDLFQQMGKEDYLELLSQHQDDLIKINQSRPERLEKAMKKVGAKTFLDFQKKLNLLDVSKKAGKPTFENVSQFDFSNTQ